MLKYETIIEYIKDEIAFGNFKHREKLPSVRSLSKQFKCSAGTVIKAYEHLETGHIVYSAPRSGYYLLRNAAKEEHKKNPIIDFSSGTPDVETFPYKNFQHCLNKSIDLYKEKLFSYGDPRGLKSLIEVLSKQLQEYQIFTGSENIIVTSGTQQALTILSTMPFPNGKSKVLVEQPTYYGMIKALELNNIPALGIERNLNGINLNELEKLFKYGNIKFFYSIPRFHNPTGTSYGRQEKEVIVKMAKKYDVYIVEDDIAADLDLNKKNDPMFYYDTSARVIYLKSYSKILMPGLRVAVLVMPDLLVNSFLDRKMWTDMNSPILSQGALEMYLKNGMYDIHKREMAKLYAGRMNCLNNTLSELATAGIKWKVPQSGYFGCLYLENDYKCNKVVEALKIKNIRLLDTGICFLKKYKNYNYFRITISRVNEADIKKGIPIVLDTIAGGTGLLSRQAL